MQAAKEELEAAIAATEFSSPNCTVYQNVDGQAHTEPGRNQGQFDRATHFARALDEGSEQHGGSRRYFLRGMRPGQGAPRHDFQDLQR